MAVQLADSHAHLDFHNFHKDLPEVLARARRAGVKLITNVGYDLKSSRRSLELAEEYPFIYAAVGIHPHEAAKVPRNYLEQLEEMAAHPKVVALGEMGLDFYRDRSPRDRQRVVFKEQLELAKKLKKPVIIHDRDAHLQVLTILLEEGAEEVGGVLHCFSGDEAMARQVIEMGFFISVAGPVTYPKNNKLNRIVAITPKDRILVETDCPFLTPVPFRGQRNEPSYVSKVAERVALLQGTTLEEAGRRCLENTCTLFQIDLEGL
ncbi:MAG: TatD family hydrolase [Firmicutes bacterium]|nr:TatD family hydrolase [Bacillota bacterium]